MVAPLVAFGVARRAWPWVASGLIATVGVALVIGSGPSDAGALFLMSQRDRSASADCGMGSQASPSNRAPGVDVGVKAGTALAPSGAVAASSSQTVNGADITGRVTASGAGTVLTVRNSRVRYAGSDHMVEALDGARIVLEDVELDGQGGALRAVSRGDVSWSRVWAHGINEGPRLGVGDIVNSRINEFFQGVNPDLPGSQPKNHVDGFQATGGTRARVLGNYIDVNVTVGKNAGYGGNAVGQMGTDNGNSTDVEVAYNYLAGGQVALAANGSGTTDAQVRVHHNTFAGDHEFGTRLARDPAILRGWDSATNVLASGGPALDDRGQNSGSGSGGSATPPDIAGTCGSVVSAGFADPLAIDPGDGPMSPASGGLRPRAQKVRAITLASWGCQVRPDPCVAYVGGYSYRNIAGTGTLSTHATGRAADVMIPDYGQPAGRALGNAVAAYFQANAGALGLAEVIWYDQIWSVRRAGEGWRPYGHPGGGRGDTVQHRDHVHVSTL